MINDEFKSGKDLLIKWGITQYELLDIIRNSPDKHHFTDEYYEETGEPKPYIFQPYNPLYRRPIIVSKICTIYQSQTGRFPLSFFNYEDLIVYLDECLFKNEDVEQMEKLVPALLKDKAVQTDTLQEKNENPDPESAMQEARSISGRAQEKAPNFFTRSDGDYWRIGFEGKAENVKKVDGLLYISYLLQKPRKSISCREFYQTAPGKTADNLMSAVATTNDGLYADHKKQAVNDYEAKQRYWKQLKQLQDDIDNAEDNPEGEMMKKESKKKQDEIMLYLKDRTFADKNDKNAQSNVTKRLQTAYQVIRKAKMKELAEHLQGHIKPDGAYGLTYTSALAWDITL